MRYAVIGAAVAAALAVPAAASAAEPVHAGPCTTPKPLVDCVHSTLVWLATYDPDPILPGALDAVCYTVFGRPC